MSTSTASAPITQVAVWQPWSHIFTISSASSEDGALGGGGSDGASNGAFDGTCGAKFGIMEITSSASCLPQM